MMTSRTLRILPVSLAVVGALLSAGCKGDAQENEGKAASVNLAIVGGDFTGNSVRVVATRVDANGNALPADESYRCASSFDGCFNLTGSNPTVVVEDLCPSKNLPATDGGGTGYWTFDYAIYTSGCVNGAPTGALLNDSSNTANLVCYDGNDMFDQQHANATHQLTLDPGPNATHLACLTVNAQASATLTSCSVESQSSSQLILDCGCTVIDANTCDCGGLTDADLQDNANGKCIVNPGAQAACSVTCCAASVNLTNDANNCGKCGTVCSGATPNCVAGVCSM